MVFDGETPVEKLTDVLAMKCHTLIRDPRQTEVRVLIDRSY